MIKFIVTHYINVRGSVFNMGLEKEQLKLVRDKLKECKPEWLEKNAKNQDSLGVWTVQQILDNAVDGITTWDFIIEEQWREEINKFNKHQGSWMFDGYVYHVRGSLVIEGLGRRAQFGNKVAVGGKDNQNSSYKAAASDCLKKCASLFGVGSSIYSKIIIDTDEQDDRNQDWPMNQQNASIAYNQQQLQNQTAYEYEQAQNSNVAYINAEGLHQNGEYIWFNNAWIHQKDYYAQKQNASAQSKETWYEQTMREYDPKGYEKMMQETRPDAQKTQEAISYADQQVNNQNTDYPFENVQKDGAKQQDFQAVPQAAGQEQGHQAIAYGAPADPKPKQSSQTKEDPLKDVVAENPWDTPENKAQIEIFHNHKKRLGISQDHQLIPHVRDYFKDEKATIASITPDTLKGFNVHLENIQA